MACVYDLRVVASEQGHGQAASELRQQAIRGNVISFPADVVQLAESLPRSAEDVAQAIEIIFTGPTGKVPLALLNMLTSIRSGVVREFLNWYLAEERCGWRVKNLPRVDESRDLTVDKQIHHVPTTTSDAKNYTGAGNDADEFL